MLLPTAAWADPPAGFAERVESLRTTWGVPGATVAIVEDGRTTMAPGLRRHRHQRAARRRRRHQLLHRIDRQGVHRRRARVLVDQGRIAWDDKIIDHMPDFRMYDPWVTREMTIRDLLVHRSGLGLGAGDLLFVPRSNLSRAETVRRLRNIRPATSFRSGYAYDNVLYVAAGQLIEEVRA